jgi:phosphoglycerate dehydrogenase-like enzyme
MSSSSVDAEVLAPTRVVILAPGRNPMLSALETRRPDLEVIEVGSGTIPPSDAAVVYVTGPWPPAAETGWAEQAASARWVHFWSAGIDGYSIEWLDGRLVSRSEGFNSVVIAEFALAMILDAIKGLPGLFSEKTAGPDHAPLGSLEDATVGLFGLGSIAAAVTKRLAGFDANVIGLRREPGRGGPDGVELVGSLAELLGRSDHLVLCAPLTPLTRHVINRAALEQAKAGIHIVNIARGPLIDHDALVWALEAGIVGRASLDLTEPDPLPDDHPLRHDPRVFITPHMAWSGGRRHTDALVDNFLSNLSRFESGEPLIGAVDLELGY